MADEADIASAYTLQAVEMALAQRQQNSANVKPGAKNCKECGEEIPTARRKLGFSLCIACAEESERKKSQFIDY